MSFFFVFIIFCLEDGVLFAYFVFYFCFALVVLVFFLRDRGKVKLDEEVVRGSGRNLERAKNNQNTLFAE